MPLFVGPCRAMITGCKHASEKLVSAGGKILQSNVAKCAIIYTYVRQNTGLNMHFTVCEAVSARLPSDHMLI